MTQYDQYAQPPYPNEKVQDQYGQLASRWAVASDRVTKLEATIRCASNFIDNSVVRLSKQDPLVDEVVDDLKDLRLMLENVARQTE